jgi:polyisoprenoid-binding protein YceI
MIKTLALALCAVALVPGAVSAAETPVSGGTYKIDTNHTLALFEVNHMGFSEFFGVIPKATGMMMLDPANPAADTLDVTLPVGLISTTNAVLDGELKDPSWLDAAKYPEIHFVATKVTSTGAHTAMIMGNLTMHGVTRPVMLDAKFTGAGTNPMSKAYTVGFSATGMIKRSDFGVTKYVPLISDDVKLKITAAFEKQG